MELVIGRKCQAAVEQKNQKERLLKEVNVLMLSKKMVMGTMHTTPKDNVNNASSLSQDSTCGTAIVKDTTTVATTDTFEANRTGVNVKFLPLVEVTCR